MGGGFSKKKSEGGGEGGEVGAEATVAHGETDVAAVPVGAYSRGKAAKKTKQLSIIDDYFVAAEDRDDHLESGMVSMLHASLSKHFGCAPLPGFPRHGFQGGLTLPQSSHTASN